MHYESYEEYLNSPEWREIAKKRAEIDEHKCCMCGCGGTQANPLQIHHITYRNLYHEDVWKDIFTVCRSCHCSIHTAMNRKTAPDKYGWKDELPIANHVLEAGNERYFKHR